MEYSIGSLWWRNQVTVLMNVQELISIEQSSKAGVVTQGSGTAFVSDADVIASSPNHYQPVIWHCANRELCYFPWRSFCVTVRIQFTDWVQKLKGICALLLASSGTWHRVVWYMGMNSSIRTPPPLSLSLCGATAQDGPRPPYCCGFRITHQLNTWPDSSS